MCKPAPFVLTADRVLWSRSSDSHEDIIRENYLDDTTNPPTILRVEITPKNEQWTDPPDAWVYRVDQDIMPAWHDAINDEARARAELPRWTDARLIIGRRAEVWAGGTAKVGAGGTAVVRAGGTAVVWDGTVISYGEASVQLFGSKAVWVDRSGSVPVCTVGGPDSPAPGARSPGVGSGGLYPAEPASPHPPPPMPRTVRR